MRKSFGVFVLAAVIPGALLAAGPTHAAPSPGAHVSASSSRALTFRAAKKFKSTKLVVTVTGVPAGASAQLKVTGPTFSKRITRSTTLSKLTPGTYRVTAATVPARGGRAVPKPTSVKIKVKAKKTARAKISYRFVANPPPPKVAPGAPTAVHGTSGDSQVALAWTAPAFKGSAAISDYWVQYSTNSGTTWNTFTHLSSPTAAAAVAGLTNGTAYLFRVAALSSAGTGTSSAVSSPITPVGVPGAPTGVSASPGNAKATVSWIAPASNGGLAITGYTVASSPGNKTCTTNGALTCDVTGLTNGTAYLFTVTATNNLGASGPSVTSSAVTPQVLAVPGAPTVVSATAGDAKATVSWAAPVSDGGSAVTGYTVTSNPGDQTCTTGGALTCDVTGLTNGTSYSFTVAAGNSVGVGAPSAASSAVIPAVPAGGGNIDPTSRASVKQSYADYAATTSVADGFTGDVNTCSAGATSSAFQQAQLDQINWYRNINGLSNVVNDPIMTGRAQEAALMMSAAGALSHSVGGDWPCWSGEGSYSAARSNLSLGATGMGIYIDDWGTNNTFVGHRRWLLYPRLEKVGIGFVTNSGGWSAGAVQVIDGIGPSVAAHSTAWPNAGYTPIQTLPSSNRWSFSYPSANFSGASISVLRDGNSVPITVSSRTDNGYGDNTIVWEMPDLGLTEVSPDTVFTVEVTGAVVSSVTRSFSYTVTAFDAAP